MSLSAKLKNDDVPAWVIKCSDPDTKQVVRIIEHGEINYLLDKLTEKGYIVISHEIEAKD